MSRMKEKLERAIEEKRFLGHKIVATGKLEHLKVLEDILEEHDLQISYIVDNDPNKDGLLYYDIPIRRPEILSEEVNDVVLIIYSPKYWRDMLSQYIALGLNEKDNILVLSRETVQDSIISICAGHDIYQSILQKYGRHVSICVCRGPIGDFFLLQLYFKQFLSKEGITDYVWVGDSRGFTKIGELYQDRYHILTEEETNDFIKWCTYYSNSVRNVFLLTIWQGGLTFNPCRYIYNKKFNFADMIKIFSLGLPADTKPVIPKFSRGSFDFATMGLEKGNTVVLAPFAYSVRTLPFSFWQTVCDRLREQGYLVAVNVGNPDESGKLQNVTEISVPVMDMVDLLEFSGYFISIRSGLCDVTASAHCKKIILYPSNGQEPSLDRHRFDYEFNSLKEMGLSEDAVELKYDVGLNSLDEQQYRRLIQDILKTIVNKK